MSTPNNQANTKGAIPVYETRDYADVAASTTNGPLGPAQAGVYLKTVTLIPQTLNPGAVTLSDGATSRTIFTGGTNSVTTLIPFIIPVGAFSVGGGWKLTTGTDVHALAVGNFE